MAVTAPFSLIYIPRTPIVRGDATATGNNILAHETGKAMRETMAWYCGNFAYVAWRYRYGAKAIFG